MKSSVSTAVLLLSVLLAWSATHASPRRQAATPTETKVRMIRLISDLEAHPFSDNAKAYRSETLKWLTEASDVSVTICPALFGDFDAFKGNDGALLVAQMALSQAKFILEYPEKASDKRAVWQGGVQGVIATYSAMKTQNPKLKVKGAEGLADVHRQGKLSEFVDSAIAKCSK
jgi:hypothetical protein